MAYKEVHRLCEISELSGPLGIWCSAQRQRRKQGALTPERIAQLDAIDFCWDPYNEIWDKRVAELVAYKEVNGDCIVSTENGILGRWCIAVRANRNRGELSTERISQLAARSTNRRMIHRRTHAFSRAVSSVLDDQKR